MDNANQRCIKVNIFTDEAPYNINLNVGRHTFWIQRLKLKGKIDDLQNYTAITTFTIICKGLPAGAFCI